MQDEALVRVPIRQSLIRPQHLAGAERELTLTVLMTSIALVFIALSWPAAIAGALLFVFGMQAARRMAKADPQMTQVYRRHIRYRSYYRARSGPRCQD
jgi:type IV secretion system protein VirB3